jgi:hypothetical protein
MKSLSATIQTTYANLLQAHLNRPVFEFEGSPFTRKLGTKTYWYANQRAAPGAPLQQRYLGLDSDEMRTRIQEMQAQRQNNADFRTYASGLVALLRAGGIAGPDRKTGPILRALANSGAFRLGGVLVGTHAFRHYDLTLGTYLSDNSGWVTQTDDIDIAGFEKHSVAIGDSVDPDLAGELTKLGFKPRPTLNRKPSTSWILADASYAIDFLTPSYRDEEGPVQMPALKMWAQSLHYLGFLIADPIDAVTPYMEGLLVKIPRPERYAVHKLIISQRRKGGSAKAKKDIEQARTLIWAMAEDQPYQIRQAIAEADAEGPAWRKALDQALDVRFSPKTANYNTEDDSIDLEGRAIGLTQTFSVSGLAVSFFMETEGSPRRRLEAVNANRSRVETAIRRQFRRAPSSKPFIGVTDFHPDDWV